MTSTPFDQGTNPFLTRYAILHHVGHGPEHWDVMFEHHGVLATWKLYHDPLEAANEQAAFRIADHRLAYLGYEGPVSGDRGTVRRVGGGPCLLLEKNSQHWRARLDGYPRAGQIDLVRVAGQEWTLTLT